MEQIARVVNETIPHVITILAEDLPQGFGSIYSAHCVFPVTQFMFGKLFGYMFQVIVTNKERTQSRNAHFLVYRRHEVNPNYRSHLPMRNQASVKEKLIYSGMDEFYNEAFVNDPDKLVDRIIRLLKGETLQTCENRNGLKEFEFRLGYDSSLPSLHSTPVWYTGRMV